MAIALGMGMVREILFIPVDMVGMRSFLLVGVLRKRSAQEESEECRKPWVMMMSWRKGGIEMNQQTGRSTVGWGRNEGVTRKRK